MDSKLAKEGREHTRATGRKTAIELVEEILPRSDHCHKHGSKASS